MNTQKTPEEENAEMKNAVIRVKEMLEKEIRIRGKYPRVGDRGLGESYDPMLFMVSILETVI